MRACSFGYIQIPRRHNFSCVSYRDPNLRETVAVFDGIADFLAKLDLGQDEFEKLVVGTMGGVDRPLTPEQKGSVALSRYLVGLSPQDVQQRRDEILGCQLAGLRGYADLFRRFAVAADLCVVGGEDKIRAQTGLFDSIKVVFAEPAKPHPREPPPSD